MSEKFLVRLVRPVFQVAYVEVEAETDNEAEHLAYLSAPDLPDENWRGRFNSEDYDLAIHCVNSSVTAEGHPFSLVDFPKYALLSSCDMSPTGYTGTQPWMDCILPMSAAVLFEKWIDMLGMQRTDYYEESIGFFERVLANLKGTDEKVVPLQPPAERRYNIDLVEAVLDLTYTLKEHD